MRRLILKMRPKIKMINHKSKNQKIPLTRIIPRTKSNKHQTMNQKLLIRMMILNKRMKNRQINNHKKKKTKNNHQNNNNNQKRDPRSHQMQTKILHHPQEESITQGTINKNKMIAKKPNNPHLKMIIIQIRVQKIPQKMMTKMDHLQKSDQLLQANKKRTRKELFEDYSYKILIQKKFILL